MMGFPCGEKMERRCGCDKIKSVTAEPQLTHININHVAHLFKRAIF